MTTISHSIPINLYLALLVDKFNIVPTSKFIMPYITEMLPFLQSESGINTTNFVRILHVYYYYIIFISGLMN